MINRRKKKYNSIKDDIFDINTRDVRTTRKKRFLKGDKKTRTVTDNSYSDINELEDELGSGGGGGGLSGFLNSITSLDAPDAPDTQLRAKRDLAGQLSDVQTASNERQDAEESNLDILDRGSRYKRKSDKLKKFKG